MNLRKSYWLLPILVLSYVLFLTASIPDVSTGTWQTWNNMGDVRSGAAAVLLQDGGVLIIGGTNANGPVASADLFGTDGNFSAAAAMQTPRSGHTATVLSDGRVLVTGGVTSGGGAVNTAEIYDPSANSWSAPATTVDARAGHTASLLSDGRVLLAGGHDSAGNALSSLEIFDPASGKFSSAGAMSVPRMNHAAATLGDGRVLIIGGTADGTNALASIDIYDPSAGTVSAGPVLSTPRMSATATTKLDGKVAVIGGNNGAASGSQDLASAEIFDPATGHLSPSASNLATARSGHQAFLLPKNNAILVLGGSSSGTDLNSAELYYSWADSFHSTGAMNVARPGLTGSAIGLDGRFLAAGGTGLASTELYGFSTVKTDAADYAPGSTVTITGSGWQPGETVTLTLLESPLIDTPPTMTTVADSNGNISNNQFSPDLYDLNIRFYLTAVGSQSGLQAQNTFTDSVTSVTITSPTSPVTITSLPSSVTVNFDYVTSSTGTTTGEADILTSPTQLSQTKSLTPGTHSASITVTVPDGTKNGTYNLKVTVTNTTGSGSNNGHDQVNGAVIINVPTDTTPPVITPNVVGTLGTNGWYTSNVAVSWTVTDPESSITSSTGCGTTNITADTAGTTLTCQATSAGGTSSQSVTIKRDATPPTLTFGAASPAANGAGWNNTNVSFSFTASDSLSGVASTTPASSPLLLTTEGTAVTGTVTVTDVAGNTATFTTPAVKIDKTPPVINANRTPTANSYGWNNTSVTANYTASDSLSGLDTGSPASGNFVFSAEGASQTHTFTVTDVAGNSASATISDVNIDLTPPTVTASASPSPNTAGWNNSDVTVSFNGSDSLSGIDSCDAPVVLNTEGSSLSATGSCKDKAGNSASATKSGIKIDKTPPTLTFGAASPAANGAGWNNTNVSFSFTASDSLSGVASTTPASSPLLLTTEGTAVTGTVTVTDVAGNTATFTTPAVKIDKTPPVINANRTPTANSYGWNNTSVTANYTASDSLSGLDTGSPASGNFVFSAEGASQTHTFTVTDLAGNSASATVSSVNIDLTPPVITFVGRTPANGYGWNNTDVTVNWGCSDLLSGPVAPSVSNTLTTEGASQSSTGTCSDKAGNSASDTQSGINIDKTPPTLNPTVSPNPVVLNGAASASTGASDSLSGIATSSCGSLVLNTVGSKTVSCTATDKAGNSNSASANYSVIYAIGGLCDGDLGHTILQPINADGSSVFNGKSTSPAKFRVCDANGISIGTAGVVSNFSIYKIVGGTVVNTVDEAVYSTTPDTLFRWDPTGLQWIFNINNKSYPSNQTYFFQINLNDGSSILFNYGLK